MRNVLATVNADLGRQFTYNIGLDIFRWFASQVCLCPPDQTVKNGINCVKIGQTAMNIKMPMGNDGKDPLEGAGDDPNVGGIVRLVMAKPGQRST